MSITSWGQKVDSLKSLLQDKNGMDRFDVLYQLAYEYIDVDDELGLHYASEASKIAKKYGDSLRIVKAGKIKSLVFESLGNLDSAISTANEILPISIRNKYTFESESILNVLGFLSTYKAEYDKALKYHFQSLQLREEHGIKSAISIALNNIGLVYYKMKDYDKALSYYERTLELRNKEGNKRSLAQLLINMSLCHGFKNNFEAAKRLVDQAFKLCNDDCSSSFLLNANYSLGVISFGLNNLAEGETQFLKSYELSIELRDERLQLDNIVYLSQIYVENHQMILAEKFLNLAEELIASGTPYNLELIKVYKGLFTFYGKSMDFEKVSYYQQKYIQLRDSIYSEELTSNLMRVESEYLERENKAKIEAQTQILSLNEEVIFRQQVVNAFTAISALLLTILTIKQIRSNRQKRAANIFLEQKVRERTRELEQSNDTLARSLDEQTVLLQKVSSNITSAVATIKGLCSLGLSDSETSYGGQYIRNIEATSDHLLSVVSRALSPKTTK